MSAAQVYVSPYADLGDGGAVGVRWGRGPLHVMRSDGTVVDQFRDLADGELVSGLGTDEAQEERLGAAEEEGRQLGHAEGVQHAERLVLAAVAGVLEVPEVRALLRDDLGPSALSVLRDELAECVRDALRDQS